MKRYALDKKAPGMFENPSGGWVKVADLKDVTNLAVRLRSAATQLRTTSIALSDFIPLLQQAADALDYSKDVQP